MRLIELQREMANAIMASPAGVSSHSRHAVQAIIRRNSLLSSMERLEIYRRSYWARVLSSFADDYPGVRVILGERAFTRLAKQYLSDCPSQSFSLRNLGSRFTDWLATHPDLIGPNFALVADMARLEWAHIEALDAADGKPIGAEDLLEPGPEMRLGLQPHITLLAVHFPVDDLRVLSTESSRRKAAAFRNCMKNEAADGIFIAVYRRQFDVYYRRLAADEFRILNALRQGSTLEQALDSLQGSAGFVGAWFESWSQMGWLTRATRDGMETKS